jgi:hypothetical protein
MTEQVTDKQVIFVSIAAFCDPYLRFTIESAFSEAAHPEHIVLGVVDQSNESLAVWIADQAFADQVRYLHLDPLHSRGVCWARHLAQTLYDNEGYFLQIDSHTWFQGNWDEVLHEHMDRLSALSKKPVVSMYPPAFEFDQDGRPVLRAKPGGSVSFFEPKPDQTLTAEDRVLTFRAAFRPPPTSDQGLPGEAWHYARGSHLAGGFLFAPGAFVKEIPYDPAFYFHGEEQGVALRALTHGWDLFHPQFCRIPLCHLYKMPHSDSPNLHWRKDLEDRRSVKWTERRWGARQRFNDLLADRLAPPYGLGKHRSLDDFRSISGLDYAGLQIGQPRVEIVSAAAPEK